MRSRISLIGVVQIYGSISKEAISKTNDVIDCVSKAIKNINDENNLLKMLGRPKLEIRYFGVTKEELLAKEILVK